MIESGVPERERERGPDRSAAILHVDLDGAREIFAVHGWGYPLNGDPLFESGLAAALRLFDDLGVRSTLFAVARSAEDRNVRRALGEACDAGHEIASHSSSHRSLKGLSEAELQVEIRDSRHRLQDLLGVPIDGFRAPQFSLDPALLETVADAGYRYDSSLFSNSPAGSASSYDRVPSEPHWPLSGRNFLELPMPGYRPMPFPFYPSYSLVLGDWYFRLGFWKWRSSGGRVLVLLFHLTDFASPLPSRVVRGPVRTLYTISHLDASEKRRRCRLFIENVARHYEIITTRDFLRRIGPREPTSRNGEKR